jgi:RimJ/RimL family protein N-acetyltransferase
VIFETQRLRIRPLASEDLPVIHRILDRTFGDGSKVDDRTALQERRSWLQWSALNQEWFPKLHQPPYGERAIALKETNTVVGAVGLVPCLDVFEQIPALRCADQAIVSYATPEVGLFWVIDPQHQRHGYATEAARAMIDFAFRQLWLKRIIATTEYGNEASQAVMRKLGMRLERNPLPDPDWLQVVGVLENQGVLHVH